MHGVVRVLNVGGFIWGGGDKLQSCFGPLIQTLICVSSFHALFYVIFHIDENFEIKVHAIWIKKIFLYTKK